jgi:hypothetical protein
MRAEREKKKAKSRETWYRGEENAPNMAPLIVDPTPGGIMYKEMLQVCQEFKATHKIGIKVVQRGGLKLKSAIKSNPLGSAGCMREKCSICKGKKKGKCDKPGIGYRQTCLECEKVGKTATYEGESSRTAYQRGAEHDKELEKKSEDSPLCKGCPSFQREYCRVYPILYSGKGCSVKGHIVKYLARSRTDLKGRSKIVAMVCEALQHSYVKAQVGCGRMLRGLAL